MPVITSELTVETQGYHDIHDLTPAIEKLVRGKRFCDGTCLVFVPGSTAAVTTIEYEPGLVKDFQDNIDRLIPADARYAHNARWGDGNGFSHIRSAFLSPSLQVPVADSRLMTGTWQQIVLVDFDNRPRKRHVIVQFQGEFSD